MNEEDNVHFTILGTQPICVLTDEEDREALTRVFAAITCRRCIRILDRLAAENAANEEEAK